MCHGGLQGAKKGSIVDWLKISGRKTFCDLPEHSYANKYELAIEFQYFPDDPSSASQEELRKKIHGNTWYALQMKRVYRLVGQKSHHPRFKV